MRNKNLYIKKEELLEKLNNVITQKNKFSNKEKKYLESLIYDDRLGLKLNFTEFDEINDNNYFLLKENKALNINPIDNNNNLIIEGDNYHVLKALQIANVKVDVIYIDPPYNTGKEFIYNDDYGTPKKVTGDDPHKHSKWLSFMKKRLEIAKDLLTEDGVIFVSINDNEQAYLKVLMDEIFGENHFNKNLIWQTNTSVMKGSNDFRQDHEYILCYSNNWNFKKMRNEELKFNNPDNDPEGPWLNTNATQKLNKHHKNYYYIKLPNGKKIYRTWRFSKEDLINNKIKLFFNQDNVPRLKIYKKNYDLNKKTPSTILNLNFNELPLAKEGMDSFTSGVNELKKILMKDMSNFTPKPIMLIKFLINRINMKNAVILDFFAGSGTTGQAVMELNEEDGGKRRFILINNKENCDGKNEKCSDVKKHQNNKCYKNICRDILRERLYRIINGKGSKGEFFKWKFSKERYYLNNSHIKYLEIKELNKINGEFEIINKAKKLYKKEFNMELSPLNLEN